MLPPSKEYEAVCCIGWHGRLLSHAASLSSGIMEISASIPQFYFQDSAMQMLIQGAFDTELLVKNLSPVTSTLIFTD